ncbi:MAG: hypothetical protein II338_04520 [Bacteroidaceae bacterium]|nr:hypothetical protein [Bacteroidaceae bacterium]MBQ5835524.1 hypothetical protein [Bacteroidaceae bacterium]
MLNVRSYNPALQQRLRGFLTAKDAEGLCQYLASLSHSAFRTAGMMLGDALLKELPSEDFWHFFSTIVPTHSKAYLGTFIKGAAAKFSPGGLTSGETALRTFATAATPIDLRKIVEQLLPTLTQTEDIELLLRICCDGTVQQEVLALMRCNSLAAYYLLFSRLRKLEGEPQLLRAHCLTLMRKGDHRSFNLACIVHHYFGLNDLPGTFSLRLENYELSRLDGNYEQFCKILAR